jgi:hypothetical protein
MNTGNAQIAVPKNQCGCVYSMAMDVNYVATSMVAAVCGRPSNLDPNNRCDINGISSPDNIWYDNKYELLFIAEDTSYHQNDVMWQFNAKTGELTRTLTSPYGAEITSTEFHHFGKCDIFEAVFQHPYGIYLFVPVLNVYIYLYIFWILMLHFDYSLTHFSVPTVYLYLF